MIFTYICYNTYAVSKLLIKQGEIVILNCVLILVILIIDISKYSNNAQEGEGGETEILEFERTVCFAAFNSNVNEEIIQFILASCQKQTSILISFSLSL